MKYYGRHEANGSRAARLLRIFAGTGLAVLCGAVLLKVSWRPGGKTQSPTSSPKSQPQMSSAPESKASPANLWELMLVNYSHKMPDGYQPQLTNAFGLQMDARIVAPFQKMKTAAQKDGVSLWISSAYRSGERQEQLFEQEIKNYQKSYPSKEEATAFAEKSVARPGYSEHNTGLAVDLNGVREDFDRDPAFRWLEQNAQDYGFILRYPKEKQEITRIKYEPWHYRYVGAENAKKMKEKGFCLEEYLNYLEKGSSVN